MINPLKATWFKVFGFRLYTPSLFSSNFPSEYPTFPIFFQLFTTIISFFFSLSKQNPSNPLTTTLRKHQKPNQTKRFKLPTPKPYLKMVSLTFIFRSACIVLWLMFFNASAGLLSEPVNGHDQPLDPGVYSTPNTVPAFPVQTQSQTCRLDLSAELFGGVNEACGKNLDRSRCCPVLAAWLYAAHARTALQVQSASAPGTGAEADLPMMPDDSQKCVNALQSSLLSRNIRLPQPNASCDAILCFCGIRLHQISSLSCPAAFNVTGFHNATPTAAVKNLERNCRNSSYSGCTKCLGALQKVSFHFQFQFQLLYFQTFFLFYKNYRFCIVKN